MDSENPTSDTEQLDPLAPIDEQQNDTKTTVASSVNGKDVIDLVEEEDDDDKDLSNNLDVSQTLQRKGLVNLGNTCYANSILQCLVRLPAFESYFVNMLYNCKRELTLVSEKNEKYNDLLQSKKKSLLRELFLLMRRMHCRTRHSKIDPTRLKCAVDKISCLVGDK